MTYSANTIADVSRQYEHCDGKLGDRNKHVAKYFSVIRRGSNCTQMRMAATPFEVENLVRWNSFADTPALKVSSLSKARAACQRHTEHVHRKSTAVVDACFHRHE